MFSVKDGDRTLQFNGTQLAKSSSERRGTYRWIEFELYRTESGSYILSRIGVSLIFHGAACALVSKYKLSEAPNYELPTHAIPCEECEPEDTLDLVFPEKYRHWAQVFEYPEGILDSLYKTDPRTGARYLTAVAHRLLKGASLVDLEIADVYTVEIVS
jgi:hypothetical protein